MIGVLQSENKKLGNGVSATYLSQTTCPQTCPLLGNGCYAESGNVGIHMRKLQGRDPDQENRDEADWIIHHRGRNPLRLHVIGDVAHWSHAYRLGRAAKYWRGPIWAYTHNWAAVARSVWQRISVLASCETLKQAKQALRMGYAPALVVSAHPLDGKAHVKEGLTLIPCPAQTRNRTCIQCKLCWNDRQLRRRNAVITFAAHGARTNVVIKLLGGKDAQ